MKGISLLFCLSFVRCAISFLNPSLAIRSTSLNKCQGHRRSVKYSLKMENVLISDQETEVLTKTWNWRGYRIRYKVAGEKSAGPAMILIHGFGGNADHFRKNIPVLGKIGPTFSIDLLGYGYSDKPDPGPWKTKNQIYCFENWAEQIADFIDEVLTRPAFLVCNSVGGCVGLQAALIAKPNVVKGLVLFNISLRMLHTSKQPIVLRPFVMALQYVLRETGMGPAFFNSVAKAEAVKNILKQCYGDENSVTDELVDVILNPGLEPGAEKVFLDFISYSGGPLPEELLPKVQVPVLIGWGEADPWEPIKLGKMYANFSCVENFVTLPGVGHCPQCEAPELVNPLIEEFVLRHSQNYL